MLLNTLEIEPYAPAVEQPLQRIIPNNVFQTFKTRIVDINTYEKINRFRSTNPHFNFSFHDDLAIEEYMASNWRHRKIYNIFKNVKFGASKADIWRYCILYQYGGIYLDFDSSISFSLNSIPVNISEIISYESNKLEGLISPDYTPNYEYLQAISTQEPNNHVYSNVALQWFLAMKKEHPILLRTIEIIENHAQYFLDKRFESVLKAVCNMTGPVAYTIALHNYLHEGNKCAMAGIDLNSLGTFKDYPAEGIYAKDSKRYAEHTNSIVYTDKHVRLNLGCGEDCRPGYINIDGNPRNSSTINIDLSSLSTYYSRGSIDEILAKDVIEHVGFPTAIRWLTEWCDLLKPDGVLIIQTPSFDLIAEALRTKRIGIAELNYLLFSGVSWRNGKGTWDDVNTLQYDWHRCCFSNEQLINVVESLGMYILNTKVDKLPILGKGDMPPGLNITLKALKK